MKPTFLIGASFRHSGIAICVVSTMQETYRIVNYQSDESVSVVKFDSWLAECLEDVEFATFYSEFPDLILNRLQCVKPRLRIRLENPFIQPNSPICLALLHSAVNEGKIEISPENLDQLKSDLSDLEPNNKGELILSPGLEALALTIGQEEFSRLTGALKRTLSFPPTISVRS